MLSLTWERYLFTLWHHREQLPGRVCLSQCFSEKQSQGEGLSKNTFELLKALRLKCISLSPTGGAAPCLHSSIVGQWILDTFFFFFLITPFQSHNKMVPGNLPVLDMNLRIHTDQWWFMTWTQSEMFNVVAGKHLRWNPGITENER